MPRRIVFFSTGLGRGGAETQLVRLALGLRRRGWEAEIVSLIDRNLFGDVLAEAGVPFHCLNIPRGRPDPRAAVRLARIIRRARPDVFCSFLVAANTLGRPVARLAGVPVVVSSIRTPVLPNPRREWMLRLTRPFHDAVVFNSQTVADDVVARGLVPADEVLVIRNGLDMGPIDAAATHRDEVRRELGLAPDDFAWIIVGHLRPEKNYPTLVRAFRAIHEAFPQTKLLSAGGLYQDHDPVLRLVPDLIETGVVQLLGHRPDVPRLLAAADAFVLSSIYDASPNGVIEAFAARLPVVATRVGGVPEIVSDGVTGVLAPTSGEEDIRMAMERVMRMPEDARAEMAAAGRAEAEARFGLERMVDEWEAVFDRLLAEAGVIG